MTSQSQLSYFSAFIGWAVNDKMYALADKMIECGNHYNHPIEDLHFFYNSAITCYYRQRETSELALEKVIEYCRKDIELFPNYRHVLVGKFGSVPRIPSFQQLAIIYENQSNFAEAISVCKLALEYGLSDGTKGGFEGRLSRLEKKLSKQSGLG